MESGVFRKGLITDKYDLDEVLGKYISFHANVMIEGLLEW
jgi:hypothetical protein